MSSEVWSYKYTDSGKQGLSPVGIEKQNGTLLEQDDGKLSPITTDNVTEADPSSSSQSTAGHARSNRRRNFTEDEETLAEDADGPVSTGTLSAQCSVESDGTNDPPSSRTRPAPPSIPLDQLSPPLSPTDIIHSAKPGSPKVPSNLGNDGATLKKPTEGTRTPKKKFSLMGMRDGAVSPRATATAAQERLRRIFSPSMTRRTVPIAVDGESEASSEAINAGIVSDGTMTTSSTSTSRRRRLPNWLCSCFLGQSSPSDGGGEFDFGQQLKTMRPTYEPESPLLPDAPAHAADRICLVLDLDETLVHSSFTPIPGADFEIPLEMQGEVHTVYVKKRPGVDNFLRQVSEWYEIVVFTASLALYANPVMDLLDPLKLVQLRLYREHCVLVGGCYVKDIAKLGRDLRRTVIVDNSPLSYVLQPENAIPITAFFTDDNDRELDKTLAVLEQARHLKDVRKAFS